MIADELQWSRARPSGLSRPDEVHVWRAALDLPALQLESLRQTLSTDELERAARFRFERHQKRFIAGRGLLRQILSYYMGVPPQQLCFAYTPYGKPQLDSLASPPAVRFNLSHAGGCALYALALDRDIGIDIERIKPDLAAAELAQRFFSPGELRALGQLPESQRQEAFFRYWARKEAFVKAIGEGLSFPLEQFDVSLADGTGWWPVALLTEPPARPRWHVRDLFPGQDYTAALVVEGEGGKVLGWDGGW